jgi:hypothetical protein
MTQRLDGVREANSSPGSLLRYPSFRRAVCVDALVRICAGAIREDRPYRDHYSEVTEAWATNHPKLSAEGAGQRRAIGLKLTVS